MDLETMDYLLHMYEAELLTEGQDELLTDDSEEEDLDDPATLYRRVGRPFIQI